MEYVILALYWAGVGIGSLIVWSIIGLLTGIFGVWFEIRILKDKMSKNDIIDAYSMMTMAGPIATFGYAIRIFVLGYMWLVNKIADKFKNIDGVGDDDWN